MNHIILIFYILCAIADTVTIVVAGFLYREFDSKVYKYLMFVMFGTFLSMIVEAVRIYSRIVPVDMEFIKNTVYHILDPAGEILQFFFLPVLVFSIFNRKIHGKIKIITILYASIVIFTFPLEIIYDYSIIHPIRDFFGFMIFYSFAYIVLAILNKNNQNIRLKKAINTFLLLGAVLIPFAFFFETGIHKGFINISHPEIPFPYLLYCLSFNILCLINAFKYIFNPIFADGIESPENFLNDHNITERENEIIILLLKGYNNDQIGKVLFISPGTVKNHIYKNFQKINVKNRTQLAYKIHINKL